MITKCTILLWLVKMIEIDIESVLHVICKNEITCTDISIIVIFYPFLYLNVPTYH